MSNVRQTSELGQDPLSCLPNQINSVVHHRYDSFPGGLFWVPLNHGEVELTRM
jgi:hypothetical protein